ncbi:unknown similar to AMEV219 [Mythimna separata entomopoxvirus 'L']|uniref:glycylpeptide N-tetradecanoyltransferase n=1 Tax=Mythimna separata entomopoxvirus 'L' TaxID=1293572 RepID=A0A916KQG4_9POXV|nr:unknown similar to AMEV219 [Mythimna separata entomopoxvirus 'L']CCU56433.1 unknown similar to AMEV219 [Mythimna separata entomopoxvirus 'L']
MSYWLDKSICKLNVNCINDIINNIDPQNPCNYTNIKYKINNLNEYNILEYHNFIYKNNNYKFNINTLKWLLLNPFTKPEFNILLYDENNIIGSISGIQKTVSIHSKIHNCIHVTLLCIDKEYRQQNLHYFLIDEIMKVAMNNNIIIAIFNSNIKFKNIKYIRQLDTYITYGNNNFKIKNDPFDYKILNTKKEDLFFVYNEDEYNYWFDDKYIMKISYNNNFISLLKVYTDINNNLSEIYIITEMFIRNNNIHKNYIPNGTILYNNYNCIKSLKLKSKLVSYIYNYNFKNLSDNIYLF